MTANKHQQTDYDAQEPGTEGETSGAESADAAPETANADPYAAALNSTPREAELEAEVRALNDKLLRSLAEAENVRRRAEREREDTAKYAVANFAREMVSVADNLRRALDTIPADVRERDETLNNLYVGVEMTERSMLSAFERFNVKRIEALGGRFDHNLHEALFEIEDKEKPSGTVLQVVEPGYTIAGRLLRPAKVGVSKGGPKGEPQAEPKGDGEAATDRSAKAHAYDKPGGPAGGTFDEKL